MPPFRSWTSSAAQEAELPTDRTPVPPPLALITLEGVDGCGKTTQAALLAATLEHAGYRVERLREPGGTAISEKIRSMLLDPENAEMSGECELLLYEASRAQLVQERIAPALRDGQVVVCDRFYDSTTAYQAFGAGIERSVIDRANRIAVGVFRPRVTLVYDVDPELAAARDPDVLPDRMEAKGVAFQQRVAKGFRTIAEEEPERVKLVEASDDIAHVLLRGVDALQAAGFALTDDDAHAAFRASFD